MTGERTGHFWDAVEGRTPMPAAAATLGWSLVRADTERGEIEVSFEATEEFLNPAGAVQGGFLTAMLDDTMGPALAATLGPGRFGATIELKVSFLRPARPGRLVGRGRVVHSGGTIAFLAGELLDDTGQVVAVGSATARIVRTD
ncbi:PaaI family thioesterase [Actinophytocola sp.]|uniref:PaaI family thioesterase n=1 Tax=Actinophytocola sp. TaxID=1872138 RepID=UPI002D31FF3E|nr:PaaI family thioesterase [Actinophytocola sp.]HYQ64447.1 PaaI family thioesterase [Actinophytocola sp.]